MLGKAQKLFLERGGKLPLKGKEAALPSISSNASTTPSRWPLLDKMVSLGILNFADYALAEKFAGGDEKIAAFICHLSLAAREGHLCVQINHEEVLPSAETLWSGEEKVETEDLFKIKTMVTEGASLLQEPLVSSAHHGFVTTPICRLDSYYYLQRYWTSETEVLNHFQRLEALKPELTLDQIKIESQLQSLIAQNKLLPEQAQAISLASRQSVTIICGGPGTGKTYTAGLLLKILLDAMPEDSRKSCEIALAAPTGKAAANLQKSISAELPPALTLHRLLGLRGGGQRKSQTPAKLSADIILIDECSMIDVEIMGHLFAAVKPGARLILLGDKHQLPPVEAGSLFADMIEAVGGRSGMLKKCLRAELQEIVDFAKAVNEGAEDRVREMLATGSAVMRRQDIEMTQQNLLEEYKDKFPTALDKESDPIELLNRFNRFRILSPLRKGSFGVDALNGFFFEQIAKKQQRHHSVAVPIMIVQTDNRLQLSNGETGVLVLQGSSRSQGDRQPQSGDYALFPCKENGFRKISSLLLPKYEYAYCMSVHKSQGSEFDHVVLLMPSGAERFGREVLYTAVTRARKKLEIVGDEGVIGETLRRIGLRLSGFQRRCGLNQGVLSDIQHQ